MDRREFLKSAATASGGTTTLVFDSRRGEIVESWGSISGTSQLRRRPHSLEQLDDP